MSKGSGTTNTSQLDAKIKHLAYPDYMIRINLASCPVAQFERLNWVEGKPVGAHFYSISKLIRGLPFMTQPLEIGDPTKNQQSAGHISLLSSIKPLARFSRHLYKPTVWLIESKVFLNVCCQGEAALSPPPCNNKRHATASILCCQLVRSVPFLSWATNQQF